MMWGNVFLTGYSLIGFDNMCYWAISVPPPMTVAEPNLELVKMAFEPIRKWTREKDEEILFLRAEINH